ncbi:MULTISPECIES: S8 family peptidase [Hyphobacterium]|uniref:S8 family serine peptidase n=1 Tax=Hyphobacterium vulgare TaxID=1736751 RepID=A0ABV7A173_9PROT
MRVVLGLVGALLLAAAGLAAPVELEPETHERLDAGERQRVIVEFAIPALDYARERNASDGEIEAIIDDVRDRVLASAFGRPAGMMATLETPEPQGPVLVRAFRYTPAAAMVLSAAELNALAREPGVSRIIEDRLDAPLLDQSVSEIGGTDLHQRGFDGTGTAIAILDTGVDLQHGMFVGRAVASACFSSTVSGQSTSFCPSGVPQAIGGQAGDNCEAPLINGNSGILDCFHGSHVAGIALGSSIFSEGAQNLQISGVAPGSQLVAVQVFSRFTGAQYCGSAPACALSYVSDQIAALEWIYSERSNHPFVAVNMSLGGGEYRDACLDDPRREIITALRSADIATVVATGNDGFRGAISAPACIPESVAVSAFGNYPNIGFWGDLTAPGTDILSAYPSPADEGGNYAAIATGTSMAAPHVAGAFALLRQMYPEAGIDQAEAALMTTGATYIRVDRAADGLAGHAGNRIGALALSSAGQIRFFHRQFDDSSSLYRDITITNSSATAADWALESNQNWLTLRLVGEEETALLLSGTLEAGASAIVRIEPVISLISVYELGASIEISSSSSTTSITLPVRMLVRPPLPANDNFVDALELNPAGRTTAFIDNRDATTEPGEPAHAGVQPIGTQWWLLTPDRNGVYNIRVSPGDYDGVAAVYRGNALNSLALVAQSNSAPDNPKHAEITLPVTAGVTYRIVSGSDGEDETGQGFLFIRTEPDVPANDQISEAQRISGARGRLRVDMQAATRTSDEEGRPGITIWYRWTAPRNGNFAFFAHEGRTAQYVDLFDGPDQAVQRGEVTPDVAYNGTRVTVEQGEELYIGLRARGLRQSPIEFAWHPADEQGLPVRAAVLPSSRVVRLGDWATAFVTLINPASFGQTLTGCRILPPAMFGGGFHFQTTDPASNTLTGTRDAPVTIGPGQSQSFVVSIQSPQNEAMDFDMEFVCDGAAAAVATPVSAFWLATSDVPRPDLLYIAATASGNGILDLEPGGTRAFAVAVVNAGEPGRASIGTYSTIGTNATIRMCETDPTNGQCVSDRERSLFLEMDRNQVRTFTVFVGLTPDAVVPFDPANSRVGLQFGNSNDAGVASVAVRTQ